jgi:thioredoxin reductase (NADPH)
MSTPAAHKPVMLAVDDDSDVLAAVARDLRRKYGRDYRVLAAESGPSALEVLDQQTGRGIPVALVLSDQRMKGMDGVSLLAEVRRRGRQQELLRGAKRALLTAYAETDDAIAAINRSQVDFYLLKPWDPPEEKLYPAVDEMLDDWRATARPPLRTIRVISDRWSARSHEIRDFLSRHQVPYRFVDVEGSDEGRAAAAEIDGNRDRMPVVVLEDGERLERPTTAELAQRIGLRTRAGAKSYDLAIVGGGPAGLAAAVYGGSEGLETVMVERSAPGGQAGTSSRIENYLGFPAGLSGADLARRAVDQARRFEVEILSPQEAVKLAIHENTYKHVTLGDGSEITSHALMITTGVDWVKLDVPCADTLAGRGLYYGASLSEARLCERETVYLVGGGNSAGQAAVGFADHAAKVVILCRSTNLEDRMSKYLVERLKTIANIEVRLRTEVVECHGSERLEGITLKDRETGATERVDTSYVFAFLGAEPRTEWLRGVLALDDRGYVLTGPDLDRERDLRAWPLARPPFLLEASVPGVFAAGDIRHESVKRVASAVGEGSVAVHFIHRYLAER